MEKRRIKGSGYIFSRNGIFYLHTTINGKRKLISLKTKNKKEAELKVKELLPALGAKTKEAIALYVGEARKLVKKKNTKLEDSWDTYLKNSARPDSGESTLKEYYCHWKTFIDSLPASIEYVEQITTAETQAYMEKRAESQISNRTYNATLHALKLVMRILTKGAENPFNDMSSKVRQSISRQDFTKEEVIKIFNVFEDSHFHLLNKEEMRVLFHIGCWTGLRLKDCVLLKWSSINLLSNIMSIVPYKVARKLNNNVIIPIHPLLKTELQKAFNWKTNEFVLPKTAERYLHNRFAVSKSCTKIIERAGLNAAQKIDGITRKYNASIYSFHSFRHSFVSFCAQAGVPMAIVQAIVGHGSPAMTKHYTHIGSETLKVAINALPVANCDQEETIREKVLKLVNAASDTQLKRYYQYLKNNSKESLAKQLG